MAGSNSVVPSNLSKSVLLGFSALEQNEMEEIMNHIKLSVEGMSRLK